MAQLVDSRNALDINLPWNIYLVGEDMDLRLYWLPTIAIRLVSTCPELHAQNLRLLSRLASVKAHHQMLDCLYLVLFTFGQF